MTTTCPHCTTLLELAPETLSALRGATQFDCPTCQGAVPVPTTPPPAEADAGLSVVTCRHCAAEFEVDEATLKFLQGKSHFKCPACHKMLPVADLPQPRQAVPPPPPLLHAPPPPCPAAAPVPLAPPVAPQSVGAVPAAVSPGTRTVSSQASRVRRILNRNILILGSAALLVLGGLAFFLASQRTGDKRILRQTTDNEITRNRFFQDVIAARESTERDLEGVARWSPHGRGMVGVSRQGMTWDQAQTFAKACGAQVLAVPPADTQEGTDLRSLVAKSFPDLRGATSWATQDSQPVGMDGPDLIPLTTPDHPRPALLHWSPARTLVAFEPILQDPQVHCITREGHAIGSAFHSSGLRTVFRLDSHGKMTTIGQIDGYTAYHGFGHYGIWMTETTNGTIYGFGSGISQSAGKVFRVDSSGVRTVFEFNAEHGTSMPCGSPVVDAEGNVFGVTVGYNGANQNGTVFKLDTKGNISFLSRFNGAAGEGLHPFDLVLHQSGDFFGATASGGAGAENGTVFRLDRDGRIETLARFPKQSERITREPSRIAVDAAGNVFGTTSVTSHGETPPNDGIWFKIPRSGEMEVLATFAYDRGRGGEAPQEVVGDSSGNLYGFVNRQDAQARDDSGGIVRLSAGGTRKNLARFDSSYGQAILIGTLSIDRNGGVWGSRHMPGPPGQRDRHRFRSLAGIFKVGPDGSFMTVKEWQSIDSYYIRRNAGLAQDRDGNFYGATSAGGNHDQGCIYRFTPKGEIEEVFSFSGLDGVTASGEPASSVCLDERGNLYGIAKTARVPDPNSKSGFRGGHGFFCLDRQGEFRLLGLTPRGNLGSMVRAFHRLEDGSFIVLTSGDSGINEIGRWGVISFGENGDARLLAQGASSDRTLERRKFYERPNTQPPISDNTVAETVGELQVLIPGENDSCYGILVTSENRSRQWQIVRVNADDGMVPIWDSSKATDPIAGAMPGGAFARLPDGSLIGPYWALRNGANGSRILKRGWFRCQPDGTMTSLEETEDKETQDPIIVPRQIIVDKSGSIFWTDDFGRRKDGQRILRRLPDGSVEIVMQSGSSLGRIEITRVTNGVLFGTSERGGPEGGGSIFSIRL